LLSGNLHFFLTARITPSAKSSDSFNAFSPAFVNFTKPFRPATAFIRSTAHPSWKCPVDRRK
jgi:hypothetical protein